MLIAILGQQLELIEGRMAANLKLMTPSFPTPPSPGIHGGPPEEQEPADEGVGGPVLLPGRAERRVRGPERRQRQKEPLCRLGAL